MPARKNLHKVKKLPPGCWLIEDWRKAWRFLSVQIMGVMAAAQGTMAIMPGLHEYINDRLWHALMGFLAIAAILGRIVNQGAK